MKILSDEQFGEYLLDCQRVKKPVSLIWMALLVALWIAAFLIIATGAYAFETQASYYTVASCLREGTGGICANGERLNDEALICASWDYRFGTRLKVTNIRNNRSVICKVADRGPSKRLYKRGRKIDLSAGAFRAIEDIKKGVCQVTVEVI